MKKRERFGGECGKRSALATLRVMYHALRTSSRQRGVATPAGVVRRVAPSDLRGGMERFLDPCGELRLLFPAVLPAAAPFILFRLKREGFSCCRAEATRAGLLITARR